MNTIYSSHAYCITLTSPLSTVHCFYQLAIANARPLSSSFATASFDVDSV